MDAGQAIFLAAAAFAAGAINGVAGGGSLVSFPALLAVGYPSKTANVTNTTALWPGYVGGTIGYRSLLGTQRGTIARLATPSVIGAVAGSVILLATSQSAFDAIVPFLILFGAGVLAFQSRLARVAARFRGASRHESGLVTVELNVGVFALAVYGAYFGAGLGTLTLALLGVLLPDDLHRSNALKGVLSLLINAVAVIWFALFGPVEWPAALVMAAAALAGGYFGVRIARLFSGRVLRIAIVSYSLVVAVILLVR
ncbi:MAG: sulfite exporter TauE/SafE family protein [Dehalococcoidia bacterium]